MPATISSEMARGRAWTAILFAVAGTVLTRSGLAHMHRSTGFRAAAITGAGLAACAGSLALFRVAQRLPGRQLPQQEAARVHRIVVAVNIIQWVAVATAIGVLSLLHLPEYLVPAVGIVIGLNLYPLATPLKNPMHSVAATMLVSWCTVCILLLPKARITGLGVCGTGIILLACAAITLGIAYLRTRALVRVPVAANLLTR